MNKTLEKIINQRHEEQIKKYVGSKDYWRREKYEPTISRPARTIYIDCIWCKRKIKENAISCRGCHKKQKPCTTCNGPIGRASNSYTECHECYYFIGVSGRRNKKYATKSRSRVYGRKISNVR
jgi:hypothetical protein